MRKKTFVLYFSVVALLLSRAAHAQLQPQLTLHHPSGDGVVIYAVQFSPDGTQMATACYGVRVWDTRTGELIREFTDFENFVQAVAFSPDGQYLITGDWVRYIKVWNVKTGELVRIFNDPETPDPTGDFINGVGMSHDNKLVMSSQLSRNHLWSMETGEMVRRLNNLGSTYYKGIRFFPDNERVFVSGSTSGSIVNVRLDSILHEYLESSPALTPDFKTVITSMDGIKLLNADTGGLTLSGDKSFVGMYLSAAPTATGFRLVSMLEDKIHLARLDRNGTLSYSLLKEIPKIQDKPFALMAFSNDGKKIAAVSEKNAYVFDVDNLLSSVSGAELYEK